jgi:hypothetical protein
MTNYTAPVNSPTISDLERHRNKRVFAAHDRVKEAAIDGTVELWIACEQAFGPQPPPPEAIFGRIFDALLSAAAVRGLSNQALITELDWALYRARGVSAW